MIISSVRGNVKISTCDRISTAVVRTLSELRSLTGSADLGFEGISRVISTIFSFGTILCFRSCALWGNNRSIIAVCVSIVSLEATLMIFSVTTWIGNLLPPGKVGCSLALIL